MKITVLGCAGGIGGPHLRTTSLLVDDDILIDAGTGAADLSLRALQRIDHVFLTHAHLDHLCTLPLMLDSVGALRDRPLTVYALPDVLRDVQTHIFNDRIWPNFARIPNPQKPYLQYQPLSWGESQALGTRHIRVLPADHVVPACAYALTAPSGQTLVFSGDTGPCPAFWQAVNALPDVRTLIIETAFPNAERELARVSKHLCPDVLAQELQQLQHRPEIYITHLKPGAADITMQEIERLTAPYPAKALSLGHLFELT